MVITTDFGSGNMSSSLVRTFMLILSVMLSEYRTEKNVRAIYRIKLMTSLNRQENHTTRPNSRATSRLVYYLMFYFLMYHEIYNKNRRRSIQMDHFISKTGNQTNTKNLLSPRKFSYHMDLLT